MSVTSYHLTQSFGNYQAYVIEGFYISLSVSDLLIKGLCICLAYLSLQQREAEKKSDRQAGQDKQPNHIPPADKQPNHNKKAENKQTGGKQAADKQPTRMTMNREQAATLLGLDANNDHHTEDEVRKVYKKMALQTHPDKNPDDREGATKKFQELNRAKDILLGNEEPDVEADMRDYEDIFGPNFADVFSSMFGARFAGRGGGFGGDFEDEMNFFDMMYGAEYRERMERRAEIVREADRIANKQSYELDSRYAQRKEEKERKEREAKEKVERETAEKQKVEEAKAKKEKEDRDKKKMGKEALRQQLKKIRQRIKKYVKDECSYFNPDLEEAKAENNNARLQDLILALAVGSPDDYETGERLESFYEGLTKIGKDHTAIVKYIEEKMFLKGVPGRIITE